MNKDTLDSRDLENRLNELQLEFDSWQENLSPEQISKIRNKYEIPDDEDVSDEQFGWEWEDEVGSDADELKSLVELREEFDSTTWKDGITFVKDSYFEEFAEDEADQLGLIENVNQWPYNCIDWSKASDQLQIDYSSVEFDGETYWYRE